MANDKPILSNIGSRVRDLREKSNMTQSELAKEMGVSRETLNHWENNERQIKATQVLKLSELFNVTCDYLLSGVSTENAELYGQIGLKDESITRLKNIYSERLQGLFPPPLLKIELFDYMLSNENFMDHYPDRLLAYCDARLDDDKDAERVKKHVISEETDLTLLRLFRLTQELADSFYKHFYKPFVQINNRNNKAVDADK